jgi:hypothetical protein
MRYRTVGLPVRLPDSGRVTDQPQVMNEAEQIWILLGSLTVMRDPSSESGGRCVGRIFDRRGWNLSHLSDPLGGFLLGLKQLLHGHGLVDMVLGLSDLFTGDQEPHIGRAPGPSAQRDERSRVVPKMVVRLASPPSRTCSSVRRKVEKAP